MHDLDDNWKSSWGGEDTTSQTSLLSTGAERIVYSLLNGRGLGKPNSIPVGSDLFFELKDAYIHIDLKTVQTNNIGDFNTNIFVGDNQNSYKGNIRSQIKDKTKKTKPGKILRSYTPNLPTTYTSKKTKKTKPCLSYFICILYDAVSLEVEIINILSMPNGDLYDLYKDSPLKAGKNKGQIRFNFEACETFTALPNNPPRNLIIYIEDQIQNKSYFKKLEYLYSIYMKQKQSTKGEV